MISAIVYIHKDTLIGFRKGQQAWIGLEDIINDKESEK
jgi:hypothetical protein